jgi:hypothetical protein
MCSSDIKRIAPVFLSREHQANLFYMTRSMAVLADARNSLNRQFGGDMKNIIVKMLLTTVSCLSENPAFGDNTVTINVTGVPYMHYVYNVLGNDFNSIEKKFRLKYVDENADNFSLKISSGVMDFSVSDIALSRGTGRT